MPQPLSSLPIHPRSKESAPLTTSQLLAPGSSSVGTWTTSPTTCSLVPSTSKTARPTLCATLSPRSLVLSLTQPATTRWVRVGGRRIGGGPVSPPGCWEGHTGCSREGVFTQDPTPAPLQLNVVLVPWRQSCHLHCTPTALGSAPKPWLSTLACLHAEHRCGLVLPLAYCRQGPCLIMSPVSK